MSFLSFLLRVLLAESSRQQQRFSVLLLRDECRRFFFACFSLFSATPPGFAAVLLRGDFRDACLAARRRPSMPLCCRLVAMLCLRHALFVF